MAIRGYFASPRHDDPWIESALDVRDRTGHLPGYGWIFPVGDGTVNVGVGLLSTFKGWKDVNTTHLLNEFAATAPAYWGISPETACGAPTGGRLPMGGSVHPKVGPTHIVVGDASGAINPFNGEGIDYAYETARAAAGFIGEALTTGSGLALQEYQRWLDAEYGTYFKVANAFAHVIGNPALMRELTRVGMQSRTLMEWVLRIMANLLRPDERGAAEAVYRSVAAIARLALSDGSETSDGSAGVASAARMEAWRYLPLVVMRSWACCSRRARSPSRRGPRRPSRRRPRPPRTSAASCPRPSRPTASRCGSTSSP